MSHKIATLVGCAIGDALGNPFEEKDSSYPPLKNWDGFFKAGGTFWKGNPGQYTDDTLMSIILSGSLIRHKGFIPAYVASSYLDWYLSGNTRGIGNTTAQAMINLQKGNPWYLSGLTDSNCAGNGSAMRASPIGLYYNDNIQSIISIASIDASITHNSDEPKAGSIAVAVGVAYLVNHYDKNELLQKVIDILPNSKVKDKLILVNKLIFDKVSSIEALAQIGTSGYVVETVGAAFYCFIQGIDFKDSIVSAVKAGEGRSDRDTIGAIVGALAGTYYGLDGIPLEYRINVEGYEMLQIITNELL